MAQEIERKFLIRDPRIVDSLDGERLTQGYLSHDKNATVRVRIAGNQAWLTIKGKTVGATRSEFEYPVPQEDARQMLDELCGAGVIDKTYIFYSSGAFLPFGVCGSQPGSEFSR